MCLKHHVLKLFSTTKKFNLKNASFIFLMSSWFTASFIQNHVFASQNRKEIVNEILKSVISAQGKKSFWSRVWLSWWQTLFGPRYQKNYSHNLCSDDLKTWCGVLLWLMAAMKFDDSWRNASSEEPFLHRDPCQCCVEGSPITRLPLRSCCSRRAEQRVFKPSFHSASRGHGFKADCEDQQH